MWGWWWWSDTETRDALQSCHCLSNRKRSTLTWCVHLVTHSSGVCIDTHTTHSHTNTEPHRLHWSAWHEDPPSSCPFCWKTNLTVLSFQSWGGRRRMAARPAAALTRFSPETRWDHSAGNRTNTESAALSCSKVFTITRIHKKTHQGPFPEVTGCEVVMTTLFWRAISICADRLMLPVVF